MHAIYIDTPFSFNPVHLSENPQYLKMVPEMEKPKITEIKVRMDCIGCVQKIKKALNGITGIYDLYVDLPQQKLTIIGWADPGTIVKAIKKTRKRAIICSHTEQSDQQPPAQETTEPPPEGGCTPEAAPPPDSTYPLMEPPHTEVVPPVEEPHNPAPEESKPRDAEEVHVIYHYPPDYGYRYTHPDGPGFRAEPSQQIYVTQSYNNNTYKPSPYVTEYAYPRSYSTNYSRPDNYGQDYYSGNDNSNITSMFSEENPNACRIV